MNYNKCLMVYFEESDDIKDIQKKIKKTDVFDEPGCGIGAVNKEST